MSKLSDTRPKPGDIVLLRGTQPRDVWAVPNSPNVTPKEVVRTGVVMPGALGLVISPAHEDIHRYFTYVLWSVPCICGWVDDGFLRKV